MKFSMALIAFVATTASALPGASNWGNVAGKPVTTTSVNAPPPTDKPMPTPTANGPTGKPPTTTTAAWGNVKAAVAKNAGTKAGSVPSPSPNPVFSAPAADASSKLGAPPSDVCNWQFILTCANQAYEAGSTCMTPMAQASTNCFSQTSCASAIGDNAASCATCFSSVGKQDFIKACYKESSQSAVAPIFKAMVSYGVCDSQGVAKNQ